MEPQARIGTTLKGKWKIDRLLGTGGFAAVFAATHRAGKRVAIKVLHPALTASEEVRRRFMKEAYAANAVDHPGVVGVSDDDVTEDGAAFLVMDLLDGETLEGRRKRLGGTLSAESVFTIFEQALDVLGAAHAKNIVHRDLKPENIFMTSGGQIKILDFGIARFREHGDEATATQTGLTMGSPAFMAPEQARGRWSEVDARTDLYALGATMFTLLSGKLVHGRGNLNETLISAATQPVPLLRNIAPSVPEGMAMVIDRALSFEKVDRWPDVRSMLSALNKAKVNRSEGATQTLPLGHAGGFHGIAPPPLVVAGNAPSMGLAKPALVSEPSAPAAVVAGLPFGDANIHAPTAPLPSVGRASEPSAAVGDSGAGLRASWSGDSGPLVPRTTEIAPPGALPNSAHSTGGGAHSTGGGGSGLAYSEKGGSALVTDAGVVSTRAPAVRVKSNRGIVWAGIAVSVALVGIFAFVLWRFNTAAPSNESAVAAPSSEPSSNGAANEPSSNGAASGTAATGAAAESNPMPTLSLSADPPLPNNAEPKGTPIKPTLPATQGSPAPTKSTGTKSSPSATGSAINFGVRR